MLISAVHGMTSRRQDGSLLIHSDALYD